MNRKFTISLVVLIFCITTAFIVYSFKPPCSSEFKVFQSKTNPNRVLIRVNGNWHILEIYNGTVYVDGEMIKK